MKLLKKATVVLWSMLVATSPICASETIEIIGGADGPTAIWIGGKVDKNTTQYGKAVHLSDEKNNLKVTLENMIADNHRCKMLISIKHPNNSPFVEGADKIWPKNMDFISEADYKEQKIYEALGDDYTVEEYLKAMVEVYPEYAKYFTPEGTMDWEAYQQDVEASHNINMAKDRFIGDIAHGSYGNVNIEMNKEGMNKAYVDYEIWQSDPLAQNMVLVVDEIVEHKEVNYDVTAVIKESLSVSSQNTVELIPNEVDEHELRHLEFLKEEDSTWYEEYKKELEQIPKHLLKVKGLNIELIEGQSDYFIDNIGIVEGKLHIRVKEKDRSSLHLEAVSPQDKTLYAAQTSSTSYGDSKEYREAYYIFDIPSLEEALTYNFTLSGIEEVSVANGPWEIPLDLEKLGVIKVPDTYALESIFQCGDTETVRSKGLEMSELGIYLKCESPKVAENLRKIEAEVSLKLKDGSTETLRNIDYTLEDNEAVLHYQLPYYLAKEDIQSIIVNEQEVILEH